MHFTQRRLSHFDARSVLLFTALALGSTAALHAQTTPASKSQPTFGPSPAVTQPAASTAQQKFVIGPGTQADAAFAKADANQDGKLSAKESGTLPAFGNHFEQLDSNHDGFLSREEFNQGAQR